MNARDACSCDHFCVRDHVLPLDAQHNPQTFCVEVVEFSGVTAVQSMTRMHRAGRLVPAICTFSLVSWLIPRRSSTFCLSRAKTWLDLKVCYFLPPPCWFLWRGCFPCIGERIGSFNCMVIDKDVWLVIHISRCGPVQDFWLIRADHGKTKVVAHSVEK